MKKTTKTTNSAFYWENRMLALEEKQHKLSKEYFQELKKIHYETLRKVKQSLESYLQRIADNENVSLARAREFIRGEELAEFKWSLETYRSMVLKSENAKLLKMIENASAKQHITRLEAKKKELEMLLYFNYEQSKDLISKSLEESCLNAFNEILKPLSNFRTLDKAVLKGVVNKPWTNDGRTFSKRLWAHHEALATELNATLQKISTGLNPRREIKLFSAKIASLQKDKTGDLLTKAERIVFTESAAARTRGEIEAFREFGFSSYSIKAVLDVRTSTVCREQNGEVYKLDEFEIGKTAPPFHPYCRSIIVPVEDEKKEEIDKDNEREYTEVNPEIEKELQERSNRIWAEEFTKAEQDAIVAYTGPDYSAINQLLRGALDKKEVGESYFNEVNSYIPLIDSALDRTILAKDLLLYRGVSYGEFVYLKNSSEINQYLSTSILEKVAQDFSEGYMIRIKAPKHSKAIYLGDLSDAPHEKEVLFMRGQKYRILSIDGADMEIELL